VLALELGMGDTVQRIVLYLRILDLWIDVAASFMLAIVSANMQVPEPVRIHDFYLEG
jgi:hypothetical protein